jgi:hypothetical protein
VAEEAAGAAACAEPAGGDDAGGGVAQAASRSAVAAVAAKARLEFKVMKIVFAKESNGALHAIIGTGAGNESRSTLRFYTLLDGRHGKFVPQSGWRAAAATRCCGGILRLIRRLAPEIVAARARKRAPGV